MAAARLLLFDIDGTLLQCGRQTRSILAAALVEVFGTSGALDGYDFSGRTDPQIVLDVMTAAGWPAAEVEVRLPRVRDHYLAGLEAGLDARQMKLLPGVAALLALLSARPDVALGLLTGNWEPGARTKLSRFNLNRHFAFGAFGGDGIHRSELPPIVLERAARLLGRRFHPEEALIVGDSVHDVACGRDHGIPVLAVATGQTPAEALRAAGANWVVASLDSALAELAGAWLGRA